MSTGADAAHVLVVDDDERIRVRFGMRLGQSFDHDFIAGFTEGGRHHTAKIGGNTHCGFIG